MLELQEKLGNEFERFDSLDNLGKSSFILGSGLWEDHFDSLLALVKEYVVNIWEARKFKLYGDDSSQSQSSTGDLGGVAGFEGHSGVGMCQGGKPDTGEFFNMYECMLLWPVRTGAWSMAHVLQRRIKYYYYYYCALRESIFVKKTTLNTRCYCFSAMRQLILPTDELVTGISLLQMVHVPMLPGVGKFYCT